MEFYPHDLLREIFLKLPVLSLLRLRTVCRSWRSIIDSPDFISEHCESFNKNSTKNQFLLALGVQHINGWIGQEIGVFNQFTLVETKVCGILPQGWVIRDIFHGVFLCQVLCRPYYEQTMYPVLRLWNPSVRTLRMLSPCPLPPVLGFGVNKFVLGFDSNTKDYKVVAFGDRRNERDDELYKIAVYSFNKDRWKMKNVRVVGNPISRYTVLLHHRHFYQGGLHWIRRDTVFYEGEGRGLEHTHFSSFDFGVEEFRCLPLPTGRQMFKFLFKFGNSGLAVFGISSKSSNMWILREDVGVGVGEVVPEKPWVRCFKGGSSRRAFELFRRNKYEARISYDEFSGVFYVLTWRYYPMRLISYDITSQQIKTIRESIYDYRVCCADAYVESLLTFKGKGIQ